MTGLKVSGLRVLRPAAGLRPAIGPVSFSVQPGTAMGVVGETGAGKTLTLRALTGLLPAGFQFSGSVQMGPDDRVYTTEEELRQQIGRHVGVVLQNPFTAFDPLKSVGSQIVEGLRRRRLATPSDARARAVELLDGMGFADPENILRLFPNQLSGGMAQRVAVAMALMPRPMVLLADEPTSALDATLRLGILELIRRFTRTSGAVLVIVSHDLRLVARFCETLVVMYGGRVVESGPAAELLERPHHPYTRALVACTPVVGTEGKRRLEGIPGSPPSLFQAEARCAFAPRCTLAVDRCWHEEPELEVFSGVSVACPVVTKIGAGQ